MPRHRLDVGDDRVGVAEVLAAERHEAFGELSEVHARPPGGDAMIPRRRDPSYPISRACSSTASHAACCSMRGR